MRTYLAIVSLLGWSAVSTAQTPPPADFTAQVKALYRVAACGSTDPVPDRFDAKVVDANCKLLASFIERYKTRWLDKAVPALGAIVPADVPDKVVYPFGGGDLVTALATFPAASEITTLSLEIAGDARKIDRITKARAPAALQVMTENIRRLFAVAHSKTTNLSIVSKGDLPGQLVFALVGLAVHDLEPLSLRYFRLAPDGAVQYLTEADIAAGAPLTNMEITFRKKGDAAAPIRTYRHISANLDNQHLTADPSPIKHLEAKGKVAAMTKAASFLLWWGEFATVRKYLLENVVWMISDSTGIPPRYAKPAGFEQVTWGRFDGPFLAAGKTEGADMKRLWGSNPYQPLEFRYGYPDNAKHSHLMVTRRITNK